VGVEAFPDGGAEARQAPDLASAVVGHHVEVDGRLRPRRRVHLLEADLDARTVNRRRSA
jgi:hypothetical protein